MVCHRAHCDRPLRSHPTAQAGAAETRGGRGREITAGGQAVTGIPAVDTDHYPPAHLCWRLLPEPVVETSPVPVGKAWPTPPNTSEFRG
jgi:hypothetical protein